MDICLTAALISLKLVVKKKKKEKKKNCRVGLQMSVYFKDYEHLTGTVDPDRWGVPSHEAILK